MKKSEFIRIMDLQYDHADQQETARNEFWEYIKKLQTCLRIIGYPKRGTREEQLGFQDCCQLITQQFSLDDLQED